MMYSKLGTSKLLLDSPCKYVFEYLHTACTVHILFLSYKVVHLGDIGKDEEHSPLRGKFQGNLPTYL